ncbi:hypothetical protein AWJ20_2094 [Sugiyamaella lignohabitans]|uniref:Major facilitator superfamily (MFS) profile domain-containing protein n=1 Tax=Sugiyamaella lignohabitans TaxID=796027 RepID=A0A167EV79_9ASCO|nr:uncharacterized protein AWJ20_2094 [Sugiyamaella lignohabitans]ANB14501.1 hypothetical protein AWJ20_2094 [Sugiyamaella lignohabitans]
MSSVESTSLLRGEEEDVSGSVPVSAVSSVPEILSDVDKEVDGVNLYMLLCIVCACVGGLMFGYDTGCISQVIELLSDDLGHYLVAWELELITSSTSLFALMGSIFAGISADRYGRKVLIAVSCVVFILAALVMALSMSLAWLVLGRSLVGLAVGVASTIVSVYIAEISPPRYRGRLVALNSVSTTGGQVLAYLSGVAFHKTTNGWRYIVGLSGIPPLLFLLVMTAVPESPRFLFMNGRVDEAKQVLLKLDPRVDVAQVEEMVRQDLSYKDANNGVDDSSLARLFSVPANFRALVVGCGLMAAQQLCCFNGFMYFSVSLFAMAGFDNPFAVSLVVSITNFVFTWGAVKYIDKVGRRAILLRSVWIMVVALIVVAFAFTTIDPSAIKNATNNDSGKPGSDSEPDGMKILTVAATIVFVASYAIGLGNIPWQAIEFLPLDVRSLGSMFITSTNWTFNTLVSASFLHLLKWLTGTGTFLLYAFFTLLAYIGIYLYYPEVAGLPLEKVNDIFKQGWRGLGKRGVVL